MVFLLDSLVFHEDILTPLILFPVLDNFDSGTLDESTPYVSYCFLEDEYPIPALNYGGTDGITEDVTSENPTWVFSCRAPLFMYDQYLFPSRTICNCVARVWVDETQNCWTCPSTIPIEGLPIVSGGSTQNHEIQIDINANGTLTNPPWDECLEVTPTNIFNPLPNIPAYALLASRSNFTYWKITGPGILKIAEKLTRPIADRDYFGTGNRLEGNNLTLCEVNTLFKTWGETGGRFELGRGGVYSVIRNGTGQKPVYFAFPMAQGIWFSQGPDMTVGLRTAVTGSSCSGSNIRQIDEDYYVNRCDFCISGALSLGVASGDITDYLASTDQAFMDSYWGDNAITIGFNNGGGTSCENNVHDFYAVSSPTPCTPTGLTHIAQLVLNSDNSYVIGNEFLNSNQYPVNTDVYIHVQARFANGEAINECRWVTLNATSLGSNDKEYINVEIRGNINNYNGSIINYQVDVYY